MGSTVADDIEKHFGNESMDNSKQNKVSSMKPVLYSIAASESCCKACAQNTFFEPMLFTSPLKATKI